MSRLPAFVEGESRGVSVVVGFVLIFGILVIMFSLYQAQVVPEQNSDVEFEHNQETQSQMVDLRSNAVLMPESQFSRATTVNLGVRYPSRTIFVNPGPATGSLYTDGTDSTGVNVTIRNAEAVSAEGETGDLWNGTALTYDTGAIEHTVGYNRYKRGVPIVYEHSVVHNQIDGGERSVPITGQSMVEDTRISVIALDGSLSEDGTGATSVDFEPISTRPRVVEVTNKSGPITLEFASRMNASVWQDTFEDQLVSNGGHITDVSFLRDGPDEFSVLELTLEPNQRYTLELTKVGVGSGTTETDPAYLTDVAGTDTPVQSDSTRQLVVEARDKFNVPQSGVEVRADPQGGSFIGDTTNVTDSEGQATFLYDPNQVGTHRINFSIKQGYTLDSTHDPSTPKNVSVSVTVTQANNNGSGGGPYEVNWYDDEENSPKGPAQNNNAVTYDASTDRYEYNASKASSLDLTMYTDPSVDSAVVEYAVSDRSNATLDVTTGSTDTDGENVTTLQPRANGLVTVYTSSGGSGDELQINITGVDSGISNFAATNPSGQDIQVSFDSNENLSTISVDLSGPENATLTETDFTNNSGTYTATYSGNSDGTYTATLDTAEDSAGNDVASNQSDTTTVDTQPPSISDFNVTNPSSQDVQVSFDSNETLSNISVDLSGPESATLTEGDFTNNSGTYTATYSGSSDGTYNATLDTAEDSAGNDAASGQFDNVTIDTQPPSISNFTATNPSGQDIQVSFDSNETLSNISVDLSGPENATLTEGDFTNNSGTYTATYSGSSDGTYNATLDTAEDSAGNDGASGQSDTVTVSGLELSSTTVTDIVPNADSQQQTFTFTLESQLSSGENVTITVVNPPGESTLDYGDSAVDDEGADGEADIEQNGNTTITYEPDSTTPAGTTVEIRVDDMTVGPESDHNNPYDVTFERSDTSGVETLMFDVSRNSGNANLTNVSVETLTGTGTTTQEITFEPTTNMYSVDGTNEGVGIDLSDGANLYDNAEVDTVTSGSASLNTDSGSAWVVYTMPDAGISAGTLITITLEDVEPATTSETYEVGFSRGSADTTNTTFSVENLLGGDGTILYQKDTGGGSVAAVSGDGGTVQTLGPSDVGALGPIGEDLDSDGAAELAYLDNSNLNIIDTQGNMNKLVDSSDSGAPRTDKALMATETWNGSGPSVFYAGSQSDKLYRVNASVSPVEVADPSDGANAVLDTGDIDGDGSDELVFLDGNQSVRYLNQDGSIDNLASAGAGANNGVGAGELITINGTVWTTLVDGSDNIKLVTDHNVGNRERTIKPKQIGGNKGAAKSPITSADVDGDGDSEIVYLRKNNNKLRYVDNPLGSSTVKVLEDSSGHDIKADDSIGVVSA